MANSLGWNRNDWRAKRLELIGFGLGHMIGWMLAAILGVFLLYPSAFMNAREGGPLALSLIVGGVFTAPIYIGSFMVMRFSRQSFLPKMSQATSHWVVLVATILLSSAVLWCVARLLIYLFTDLFPDLFV